jgi:alpha-1,2-mannosyltransferase
MENMSALRLQRIFIISGIISLSIAYVGLWFRFINNPVERTSSDFIAFYSAGRVAQEGGFSQVYDPALQQAIQEEEVGFPLVQGQVLLYNHLPFLIPILRMIVGESYVGAFYQWVVLLLIVYVLSMIVLSKVIQASGTDWQMVWGIGIAAFLFLPIFLSLMNGQDTAILVLGAALWLYGLASGNDWIAGLGLSLTTVRPHLSLAFAIPMIVSHRKTFYAYVLGSSFLAALSVLIVGIDGTRQFINVLLISTGGVWHGMNEESMVNLLGLVIRIFGTSLADVIRAWGWVIFAATILFVSYLWSRKKGLQANLMGLTVLLALFTSPHLHFHDLALLLIPFYELVRCGYLKHFAAMAFPIAASLAMLVSNMSPVLLFTTPYLLMLVLAVYPYLSKEKPVLTALHRS